MTFWDVFLLLFIFIPLTISWIYSVIDIFRRPDIGGLAKFSWLVLVLVLPLLGMFIYFLARPADSAIARTAAV